MTYKVVHNLSANLESVSFYTKIKFVNNLYGSQHSHFKRSSCIIAAWCGIDSKKDSITIDIRPGQVLFLFYFKHYLTIGIELCLICLCSGTSTILYSIKRLPPEWRFGHLNYSVQQFPTCAKNSFTICGSILCNQQ